MEYLDQDVVLQTRGGVAFVGHVVGIERSRLILRLSGDTTRLISLDEIAEIRRRELAPAPPPGPAPAPGPTLAEAERSGDSPSEPPFGRGLMITGSVMLAVGAAEVALGAGLWFGDACSYNNSYYTGDTWVYDYGDNAGCLGGSIATFSLGVAQVVAGIPMLVVGSARHKRWQAWKTGKVALRPTMRWTARSWGAGLSLQF